MRDATPLFKPAMLLLENGIRFQGSSPDWQKESVVGEVVFTTGMTGYDLSLTDPSFAGQILVFTSPLIGNYGIMHQEEWESEKIHANGIVLSNLCLNHSHGKAVDSLLNWLKAQSCALIHNVDTRQLTKCLRDAGSMPGAILPHDHAAPAFDREAIAKAQRVALPQPIEYQVKGKKVILVDCGMKASILRSLQPFPLTIKRVPFDYDYTNEPYDAILLSNGPGNPEHYNDTIAILKKAMEKKRPIFGICLGAQLMALAAGAKTYKLPFGHRGHNQPCIDVRSGSCYITSQNHGYAVCQDSLPAGWQVSFRNLNDGTVEGIAHHTLPFSAVQFHPEAAPGPTDTSWLFQHFYKALA